VEVFRRLLPEENPNDGLRLRMLPNSTQISPGKHQIPRTAAEIVGHSQSQLEFWTKRRAGDRINAFYCRRLVSEIEPWCKEMEKSGRL